MTTGIGATRLEVSTHPLFPGREYQVFVSQAGRASVRWFQIQLLCEEHATYHQGTDTRTATAVVHRETVFSQRNVDIAPDAAFEASFSFRAPASAMHSFAVPHNAVTWALVVRGRMARWPEFERRFPLYVYPDSVASQFPVAAAAHAEAVADMKAATKFLKLDRPSGDYQPGEKMTGYFLVEGNPGGAIRAAELSLLWYTTGQGEEDFEVHHFERFVDEHSQPLDLRTPRRFHGRVAPQPAQLRRANRQSLLVCPVASLSTTRSGNCRGSPVSLGGCANGATDQ